MHLYKYILFVYVNDQSKKSITYATGPRAPLVDTKYKIKIPPPPFIITDDDPPSPDRVVSGGSPGPHSLYEQKGGLKPNTYHF